MAFKLLSAWSFANRYLRAKPICSVLTQLFDGNEKVLDIGCSDGSVSNHLNKLLPGLNVSGVDILLPKEVVIPAKLFDGKKLPFKDNSFDTCLLVDVVHHSQNPLVLLKEAKRVSKKSIIIKDMLCRNAIDKFLNMIYDSPCISLLKESTYYRSLPEWEGLFSKSGLNLKTGFKFKAWITPFVENVAFKLEV